MTEEASAPKPHRSPIPPSAWPITVIASAAVMLIIALTALPQKHKHTFQGGYVGAEVCANCHPKQFESWKETRMAQSFEVLKPGVVSERKVSVGLDPEADYTRNAECLACHVTGYGRVGGFVSIETTPTLAGVTCEACHGAGGMYAGTTMSVDDPSFDLKKAQDAGLIYPPTAEVCKKCHNDKSPFVGADYEFEFAERVKRGTHQHFQLKYSADQQQ